MNKSWYFSTDDGERCVKADTRESAIKALGGQAGIVGLAVQNELKLSDHVSAEDMLVQLDEQLNDSDGNLDTIFDINTEALDDLQDALKKAADDWQRRNNLKFHAWCLTFLDGPHQIPATTGEAK